MVVVVEKAEEGKGNVIAFSRVVRDAEYS